MMRARDVLPAGGWTGEPADSVVLDFEERHRRRVTMAGVRGVTPVASTTCVKPAPSKSCALTRLPKRRVTPVRLICLVK